MAVESVSRDSSTSYLNCSQTQDKEVMAVRDFAKELLKSRLFLGRYIERRLVDGVGYRDVILLSAAEVQLQRDLELVKNKLLTLGSYHWIGITDSEHIIENSRTGMCLWTEIDDQPLGPIWFQIKTLAYREKEVIVKVRCIRHISESYLELEPLLTEGIKTKGPSTSCKSDVIPTLDQESVTNIITTLKSICSVGNLKEFVTFVIAFFIAIFTGSIALVRYLGNFVLALVRESSIFVHNATPMFLGVVDFCSKTVGGFYLLLAIIFKQNTPIPKNDKRKIDYHPQHKNYDYGFD